MRATSGRIRALGWFCGALLVACAQSRGNQPAEQTAAGTAGSVGPQPAGTTAAADAGPRRPNEAGTALQKDAEAETQLDGAPSPMAGAMGPMTAGSPAGSGATAGTAGLADSGSGDGGMEDAGLGPGTCCEDGDCLCRGPDPTELTADEGPYEADFYYIEDVGCVHYPTDAQPPFAAVALTETFIASGGCGTSAARTWGPFYASWGIVALNIDVAGDDQPADRGQALLDAIAALKAENERGDGELSGRLANRYGILGFSLGGGSYAAQADASLRSYVALMPWNPVTSGVEVPTLLICGSADGIAACETHGDRLYDGLGPEVPKMRITIPTGHSGLPGAGRGDSGKYGLAFQKAFLEGDDRWRALLVAAPSDATNIE